jgi:hypothetical protein
VRALTERPFGPVIRALLSQIAINLSSATVPATVVQARRDEIAGVIARGVARGDLRPDAGAELATEPWSDRPTSASCSAGRSARSWPTRVVDTVLNGFGA